MIALLETPAGIVLAVALCLAVCFASPRFFKWMFPPDLRPELPTWLCYVSNNVDDQATKLAYGWKWDKSALNGVAPIQFVRYNYQDFDPDNLPYGYRVHENYDGTREIVHWNHGW